ncbi:MAG: bifunctional 5,10-methylenetetrahydrofolate dehydrogenase/5,10-methenyltetrahydrofolate cyclohydrolase [Chloroflexota bacterium]|nr:bifunctional 5,10-methylenetetrahydrofolate dehydrogenase/5,10-methenyltetrahydrofolate cyclohydrolase [Chloroflexota bacterium]
MTSAAPSPAKSGVSSGGPTGSPATAAGSTTSSTTRSLVGAPIAAEIKARVKTDVAAFRKRNGYAPTLAVVLVGRDAPSAVYLHQILRTCNSVGITGRLVEIPGRASAARVRNAIVALNEDPLVAGIIVQMPLPKRIPLTTVTGSLDPAKDIDGIQPINAGHLVLGHSGFLPTTAQAAVEILKRSGIPIEGRRAVVVGRSNVVGKPAALLLLRENATVTVCHSHTTDLGSHLRDADIVVVAVGKPGLITGQMLKRGAVVVDVGINVVGDRIVGDVDAGSVGGVASALTPVPGGVGPVTNALLMTHLIRAAEEQVRSESPGPRARRPAIVGFRL